MNPWLKAAVQGVAGGLTLGIVLVVGGKLTKPAGEKTKQTRTQSDRVPARSRVSEPSKFIGSVRKGEYNISTILGIEQFENGKLTPHRYQLWYLTCSFPTAGKPTTSCDLERTVFDQYQDDDLKTVVSIRNHSTSDGTLRITNADWERGKLDFSVMHALGPETDVMLRMKYVKVAEDLEPFICLNSFNAVGISWILSVPIEYRIPEYSYTLNFPVIIHGMRSEEDRRFDDLVSSLSDQDRAVYDQLKGGPDPLAWEAIEAQLKNMFPGNPDREPTRKEYEAVMQLISAHLVKRLTDGGMSKEGLKKFADYMSDTILKEVEQWERRAKLKPRTPHLARQQ